ncbi:MAG: aminofutalosine synthase MqnE, partial [Candidatus Eremiobacteraeota bacterium]|nr:aminofutalosine synthase MqnE [Candidatus Eremiobacteraeota bacterium]
MTDSRMSAVAEKVRSLEPLNRADGEYLFSAAPFHEVGRLANEVRTAKNGRRTYYVFKRYLNTTNVCYADCKFCSFAAWEKDPRAYRWSAEQIVDK